MSTNSLKKVLGLLFFSNILLPVRNSFAAPVLDYYTFDGYQPISDAFTKLGLIFADASYLQLGGIAIVVGIVIGGLFYFIQGISGLKPQPATFFLPALLGVGVWLGLFARTADLIIYDEFTNQFTVAADVPVGIAWSAVAMNRIERGFIDLIDVANPANAKVDQIAGGMNVQTLNSLLQTTGTDIYLKATLAAYTEDCVLYEMTRPGSTLDMQGLMTGNDARTNLAKAVNPSVFTTVYSATNPNGVLASCTSAWGNTLGPALGNASTFTNMINAACGMAGFESSDALQVSKCTSLISSVIQGPLGVTGGTQVDAARQSLIANVVFDVIKNGDPATAIALESSRKMATGGYGNFIVAQEWLPIFKAVVTAVGVSLIPFIALFIPTPLIGRALSLIFGIFAFLAIWGITDAIITSGAGIYYLEVMEEASQAGIGLQTVLNFPGYSAKILGMFGMVRSAGFGLAGVLSFALIKLGGVSQLASGIGGSISNAMQSIGTQTGSLLTPEGKGSAMTAALNAGVSNEWFNSRGFSYEKGVSSGVNLRSNEFGRGLGYGTPETGSNTGFFSTRKESTAVNNTVSGLGGSVEGAADLVGQQTADNTVGSAKGYSNVKDLLGEKAPQMAAMLREVANVGSGSGLGGGNPAQAARNAKVGSMLDSSKSAALQDLIVATGGNIEAAGAALAASSYLPSLGQRDAAQTLADYINENGGIGGRMVTANEAQRMLSAGNNARFFAQGADVAENSSGSGPWRMTANNARGVLGTAIGQWKRSKGNVQGWSDLVKSMGYSKEAAGWLEGAQFVDNNYMKKDPNTGDTYSGTMITGANGYQRFVGTKTEAGGQTWNGSVAFQDGKVTQASLRSGKDQQAININREQGQVSYLNPNNGKMETAHGDIYKDEKGNPLFAKLDSGRFGHVVAANADNGHGNKTFVESNFAQAYIPRRGANGELASDGWLWYTANNDQDGVSESKLDVNGFAANQTKLQEGFNGGDKAGNRMLYETARKGQNVSMEQIRHDKMEFIIDRNFGVSAIKMQQGDDMIRNLTGLEATVGAGGAAMRGTSEVVSTVTTLGAPAKGAFKGKTGKGGAGKIPQRGAGPMGRNAEMAEWGEYFQSRGWTPPK